MMHNNSTRALILLELCQGCRLRMCEIPKARKVPCTHSGNACTCPAGAHVRAAGVWVPPEMKSMGRDGGSQLAFGKRKNAGSWRTHLARAHARAAIALASVCSMCQIQL
eukprot:1142166-Pelagomonas_calceolata.AAC.3